MGALVDCSIDGQTSGTEDFIYTPRRLGMRRTLIGLSCIALGVFLLCVAALGFSSGGGMGAPPVQSDARDGGAWKTDMDGVEQWDLDIHAFDGSVVSLDQNAHANRDERLATGPTRKVYHQTTMDSCRKIKQTGFHIGNLGIVGRGMYFAESARQTGWKAEHWGCMIETTIKLGATKRLPFKGDRSLTGEKLLSQGYDSVWVARGIPHGSMPEWVVYFRDQIESIDYWPCNRDGTKRHR